MRKKIENFLNDGRNIYRQGAYKIHDVKNHMFKLAPYWIAGSITAVTATIYAKIFTYMEHSSSKLLNSIGPWVFLYVPILFLASWFLVEKIAPASGGSGIPQLMVSTKLEEEGKIFAVEKFLNIKIIIIKILSSLISVLSGGAVGREGPTLQISGSIFYIVQKHWPHASAKPKQGFLLAGAASGLASAFNTPLGGIVYVIEELAKSKLSSFRTGVLHSVIFAGLISQIILGTYLYLGYPKVSEFSLYSLLPTVFLSLASGLGISFFSVTLKKVIDFRYKLLKINQKVLVSILIGLAYAFIIYQFSGICIGSGKEVLNDMLFNNLELSYKDILGRYLSMVLTYTNGGAGGIFAPTLSLGGMISGLLSSIFQSDLGSLAILVGMTSGLAALTHSPLTSFILILEMTDRRGAILPLMIAAVVGHGISKLLSKDSFYEYVAKKIIIMTDSVENKTSIER